jgi:quercetin dioxygenase-like cupin family protein
MEANTMKHNITRAVFYPKYSLKLSKDVPGAKMWAVALKKTMLTYFEVRPGCVFKTHKHKSEQITMVLEGELFFSTENGDVRVGPGEALAFPSNVPHGTFTRTKPAKAVDAWSPVMKKYRKKEARNLDTP